MKKPVGDQTKALRVIFYGPFGCIMNIQWCDSYKSISQQTSSYTHLRK